MYDLDDDDPFGPAKVEINHNVVQYDAWTAEDQVDGGVDANYCEAHAVAMKARLEEWE
jgi:hypothetical protein